MTPKANEFQLDAEQSLSVLESRDIGILSTMNEDGTPYAVPVNYIFVNGKIYIRTSPHGQKISNIIRDPECSFAVFDAEGYNSKGKVDFESVSVKGKARLITDNKEEMEILRDVANKYKKSENGLEKEASALIVIEIVIEKITGIYRSGI